jgi:hypothetical protein
MKIRFLILSIILLASCSQNKYNEDLIISEEKMIDVLFDVQISETYIVNSRTIKVKDININPEDHYKYIFKKHQISKEQFDESIKFYEEDLEKFKMLYDSVEQRLQKLKTIK